MGFMLGGNCPVGNCPIFWHNRRIKGQFLHSRGVGKHAFIEISSGGLSATNVLYCLSSHLNLKMTSQMLDYHERNEIFKPFK